MSKDDSNPEINKSPSIYWEKFFNHFLEIETIPVKEWKVVHLLAYFSKRYYEHYKINYSFRFNSNSPSKSYEVWQVRKLGQVISTDPEVLKSYVDWFFETKIILKKKRITSLSFLSDIKIANEFKLKNLAMDRAQNIDRTTILPANLLDIAAKLKVECKTYGDLAFLYKAVDVTQDCDNEAAFITQIKTSGFDLSVLDKVK